jgi:peptide/nickel transport system permease protein
VTVAASDTKIELPTKTGRLKAFLGEIRNNRNALLGLIILVPIVSLTVLSVHLPIHDPTATHVADRFADPSLQYLFGTDGYGRDLLARTLVGGRTSLFLGVSSVLFGLVFGVPVGLVAGYNSGNVDEVLMRAMDVLLSFPGLLLALLVLVALEGSIWTAILAIGIIFVPRIARVVRGSTLSVKNEEFVEAAQARGESDLYILFKVILPNVASPIIVEATIRVGFAILIGTAISFLGLGTQPPNADWGYMIAQARKVISQTPWFLFWPSLWLGLTVVGFNLLGDGLRDILNPKETGENL